MFETFKQQKEGQRGWCETERQRGREREGKKILMSININQGRKTRLGCSFVEEAGFEV